MAFNIAHIKEKLAGLHEGNKALMVVGHCQVCGGKLAMFEKLYVKCLANGNHVGKFFYPYNPEMGWKVPPVKMVDLGEFSAEVEGGYKKPMTSTKWNDAEDSVVGAVQSWSQQVMGKAWDDIVATYKDKEPLMKFTSDSHMGHAIKHPTPIKTVMRHSGAIMTNPCVEVEYPCVFQSKPNGVMYKLKMPPPYVPPIPNPRSPFGKMVMKKIEDSKKVA